MDAEVIRRAQGGDEQAFASLAVAMGDRLHAVAQRILRDTSLAEDATQRALLSIWRDLPQLREPERFEAWAYRLLVRACYAEGKRSRIWSLNLFALRPDDRATTEDLSLIADRDQLERGFQQLSVDHRAVVVLRHYLDLSDEEIARTLDIPVGTVRSRLHYAMRALRSALEADSRQAPEVAR